MARYVSLIRFTDQGARAMKQSAARALVFDKVAGKAGVKVETQLWTAGSCDGLLILKPPRPARGSQATDGHALATNVQQRLALPT